MVKQMMSRYVDGNNSVFQEIEKTEPVFAMSTKKASSVKPKWSTTEKIVLFCKKIEIAWEFCKSEELEESKSLRIPRVSLPTDVAEIYDNLISTERDTAEKMNKNLIDKI
jgi:hypothetical protein